ncbi:MAG: type II methionyl aminopeptidase [Promethearchaeota archaeon]
MDDKSIESYIKAGKAVKVAKELAKNLIKPGVTFLEIANKCEEAIIKQGCELSFPINMSLDSQAAHYSPIIDDPKVIPEKGLLKIDIGSHNDGYIADTAITFNINDDPKLQNYIEAATEALDAAVKLFKPGIKLYEIGEAIAEKILSRGLRPITNLGGHELKRFNLHAGPFVPNFKDLSHKKVIQPGEVYACEPFATSGVGTVINGDKSYIYRFVKKVKKNLPYDELNYMKKIEQLTQYLPFSPRLIEKHNIIRKRILDHYPLLIEKTGAPVAQQEHTILIDLDGNPIVTT